MVRSQSIYPVAGWSLGAPNVPDPLATVTANVNVPYISQITGLDLMRLVQMGYMLDDSVHNSGGIASTLEGQLEILWRLVKREWEAHVPVDKANPYFNVQTTPQKVHLQGQTQVVKIAISTSDKSLDYWYGTTNVAKYGWLMPMYDLGFFGPMQFINSPAFMTQFANPVAGILLFLHGRGTVAAVELFKVAKCPKMFGTDFYGNSFQYNDDGYTS